MARNLSDRRTGKSSLQKMSMVGERVLGQSSALLRDNAEDISYRMYDLFFRAQPQVRRQFGSDRTRHPNIITAILLPYADNGARVNGTYASQLRKICDDYQSVYADAVLLAALKASVLQAMADVLFDELTPAMRSAWDEAFDCVASYLNGGVYGVVTPESNTWTSRVRPASPRDRSEYPH